MRAGNPEDIGLAAPIRKARRDEQIVGKPVDVGEDRLAHLLVVASGQGDDRRARRAGRPRAPDAAPPPPRCRAGSTNERSGARCTFSASISRSRCSTCAGATRSASRAVSPSSRGGTQRSAPRSNRSFCVRAKVASMRARSGSPRARREAREADEAIELVDFAIGRDARVELLATLAIAEARRAVVAGACVDAVEPNHQCRRR